MQKILIPVDGSEQALKAVKYASTMLKNGTEGQLHLLNVQEHLDGKVQAYRSLEEIRAIEAAHAEQALINARKVLEEAAVPYVASKRVGPVAKSIANYAQEEHCDCIIIGTHGRGALANLLLGSVMNKVVHMVKVPVTVVR